MKTRGKNASHMFLPGVTLSHTIELTRENHEVPTVSWSVPVVLTMRSPKTEANDEILSGDIRKAEVRAEKPPTVWKYTGT